jgi:hypothetical protein
MSKLVLLFTLLTISAISFSDPLDRFSSHNIAAAKEFGNEIKETEWVYSWRGRDFKIRFNENGSIGFLESWQNIKWYVSGENEVVLEAEHSKMLLNFNTDRSVFFTRDWDGEKSDGRIIAKSGT